MEPEIERCGASRSRSECVAWSLTRDRNSHPSTIWRSLPTKHRESAEGDLDDLLGFKLGGFHCEEALLPGEAMVGNPYTLDRLETAAWVTWNTPLGCQPAMRTP